MTLFKKVVELYHKNSKSKTNAIIGIVFIILLNYRKMFVKWENDS